MLDIRCSPQRGHSNPPPGNIEFCKIVLSSMADGRIFVSLTATTIDDLEPQLLDQEIACDEVATIDDALALIRAHVSIASHAERKGN